MIFYTQRLEAPHSIGVDQVAKLCTKLGISFERFEGIENLLKVWLVIEYVHDRDFWRRQFFADRREHRTPVKGKLITIHAPAYLYFAGSEADKILIDVIALDKRSFDAALTAINLSGETIIAKNLSLDHFPDDAPVEAFYIVDYSTNTERMMGFDKPRPKKEVLQPPSEERRYFSMTFATDFSLANGTRLTAIGWEENGFTLNIVEKDPIAEPLREENQKEFIRRVSSLLGTLYQDPGNVCTRRV